MRKKRRKKGWSINPVPVLVLLLAINVAAGIAFSPILALNSVRVLGSLPSEKEVLNNAIQKWADKPLARVNSKEIESRVLSLPEVSAAHFEKNLFGRGELRITLRQPVAKIEGADLVLAADGGLFRWPEPLLGAEIPRVSVPSKVFRIGLAIQGGTELGGLVSASQELERQWPGFDGVLELNQVGVLCLNRFEAGRVILGGFDQLAAKLSELRRFLALHPEFSSTPVEINLVAADQPRVRPLVFANEPHLQSLSPQGKLDRSGKPALLGTGLHADPRMGYRPESSQSPGPHGSQPASPSGSGTHRSPGV